MNFSLFFLLFVVGFASSKLWLTDAFFKAMWDEYTTDVTKISRHKYSSTCTLKATYAWNQAIEKTGMTSWKIKSGSHVYTDDKGRNMMVGVQKFKDYLKANFGAPPICKLYEDQAVRGELKGIIIFGGMRWQCPIFKTANGHVDLYDASTSAKKKGCRYACHFRACYENVCLYPVLVPGKCFHREDRAYYDCKDTCSEKFTKKGKFQGCSASQVCCAEDWVARRDEEYRVRKEKEKKREEPVPAEPVPVSAPPKTPVRDGTNTPLSGYWSFHVYSGVIKKTSASDTLPGSGVIDPRVIFKSSIDEFATPTADNTLNPTWNFSHNLKVKDSFELILMKTEDVDPGGNELIGAIKFNLKKFADGKAHFLKRPIKYSDDSVGHIGFRVRFFKE